MMCRNNIEEESIKCVAEVDNRAKIQTYHFATRHITPTKKALNELTLSA